MRTIFLASAMLLIALAPFGEGGRLPLPLFLLHLLAFVAMTTGLASPRPVERVAPEGRRIAALLVAGTALGAVSAALAAYPFAGLLGFMDLLAAAGLFLAAFAWRAGGRELRILRAACVASTAAQAVLAIVRYPSGGVTAAAQSFLNPNHLAAWIGAGLLICVAEAEERVVAGRRPRTAMPWIVLAALHFVALALLASRGALLGLATALAILVMLRARRWTPSFRKQAAAALLLALVIGGAAMARRFRSADDPYRYHRLRIWSASAGLVLDAPLLGAGPGMFRHVAPRRAFPLEGEPFRFERGFQGAHSGWLTLLVEHGLPGAVCLAAAAVLAALALLGSAAGSGGALARGVGLLLVAFLAQAFVEDLQSRPALTLVPALLAGAAIGRTRGRPGRRRPSVLGSIGIPVRVLAAAAAASLLWAGVVAPYWADRLARRAHRAGANGMAEMRRAARLNPLHPEYQHDLAMAALNSGPLTPERYAEAFHALDEARRLKPIDPRFPVLLARLEAIAGSRLFDDPAALEHAERLYREAADRAPFDPRPRTELAGHLLERGLPHPALAAAQEALDLEPNYLKARLLEARLLLDLGRRAEAREAWRRAETSRSLLTGAGMDSGYARELSGDVPEFRLRLQHDLARVASRP